MLFRSDMSVTYDPDTNPSRCILLTRYLDVSGSSDADAAIILIYDVFGFTPQITQGADMLANATGGKRKYKAFMPDFLKVRLF